MSKHKWWSNLECAVRYTHEQMKIPYYALCICKYGISYVAVEIQYRKSLITAMHENHGRLFEEKNIKSLQTRCRHIVANGRISRLANDTRVFIFHYKCIYRCYVMYSMVFWFVAHVNSLFSRSIPAGQLRAECVASFGWRAHLAQ